MPSVPEILAWRKNRRFQRENRPSSRLGRLGMGCGLLVSLAIALQLIGLAAVYAILTRDLPPIEKIPALIEPPNGLIFNPTRLYDRTGEHILMTLQNGSTDGGRYLSLDTSSANSWPVTLAQATIAVADPSFWQHSGFSRQGILEGTHPTLAQRLVDDFLLWDEPRGLRRALRERLLAAQLTAKYGRQKILEWYLNSADYGQYAYGAEAASQAYFGKSAKALSLTEAAALAGIAEHPVLSPSAAPEVVWENKNLVLKAMAREGYIDGDQLKQAADQKLTFKESISSSNNQAAAFARLVISQLGNYVDIERLSRGGFDVITTLDLDLQTQANCASAIQLARLSDQAPGAEEPAVAECQAARLLTTFPAQQELAANEIAASTVILDPSAAQVLALTVTDPEGIQVDHIPVRPPGSILTPFVYLTAFSRGMGPASLVWDIPREGVEIVPGDTQPGPASSSGTFQNPDGKIHGPVRVRTALANDYLLPAAQVLSEIGAEQVWQTAEQLGLDEMILSKEENSPGALFGAGGANLLDLVQAFGTFANQGVLVGLAPQTEVLKDSGQPLQPQFVMKVQDHEGNTWLDCEGPISKCHPIDRPVISPQLAYLINHILSDETSRWPSLGHPNPLEVGRPAAAKIGQTARGRDAWTIGYTPDLVVGTWIGGIPVEAAPAAKAESAEDMVSSASSGVANQDAGRVSPRWAAGLWHALLQYATRDRPAEGWVVPPGISEILVCDPSGLLPTPECPGLVREIFLSGREPTSADNLYRSFRLNRETGRLATLLTRPELIEDRVFMVVPTQAAAWAQQVGIPPLPQAYDLVDVSTSLDPDVTITSPAPYSSVGDRVVIRGTASGPDFKLYRLQIGQGLDPDHWLQLGEDHLEPVEDGELAVWDTTGLSGLYALQLLVMREDQSVQTETVQVSVDNEAPRVSIRFPSEGQHFSVAETEVLTFLVETGDDLGIASVTYWLNGKQLDRRESAPYTATWETRPGEFTLKVRAADQAGNWSEDQIEFSVDP